MEATIIRTDTILAAIKNDENSSVSKSRKSNIFIVKSGSQWLKDASNKPEPTSLFLCFWYQDEVCILFADTNLGKSILAVQIADTIAATEPVLYIDFELSDKQFEARYSNDFIDHYPFPENFLRAEIDTDKADYKGAGFDNLEDYINHSIEMSLSATSAKILIIDNLTYLRNETEKSREALPLMKHLKALKKKHGLSILVLAHTPKRNLSQPLTRNDLSGSKMLINFCDSAFAIGESTKDKRLRYLKQIKCRNSEILYDSENVAVYEIAKSQGVHGVHGVHSFLAFNYVHTSCEREHLKQYTPEDRQGLKEQAKELSLKGKSQREIAKELNISVGVVNKYIRE